MMLSRRPSGTVLYSLLWLFLLHCAPGHRPAAVLPTPLSPPPLPGQALDHGSSTDPNPQVAWCRTIIQRYFQARTNLTVADLSGHPEHPFSTSLQALLHPYRHRFIFDPHIDPSGDLTVLPPHPLPIPRIGLEALHALRDRLDIGIIHHKNFNHGDTFLPLAQDHLDAIVSAIKPSGILLILDTPRTKNLEAWRHDLATQFDETTPFPIFETFEISSNKTREGRYFLALLMSRKPVFLESDYEAMSAHYFTTELPGLIDEQIRIQLANEQPSDLIFRKIWEHVFDFFAREDERWRSDPTSVTTMAGWDQSDDIPFELALQNYLTISKKRLFRELFRIQLAETAPDYRPGHFEEMSTRSTEPRWPQFAEHFKIVPGMTVADVGCGTGNYTFHMAREVGPKGRVYAVDVQKTMLDLIGNKARSELHNPHQNITILQSRIDDARLPEASFDHIYLINIHFHNYPRLFETNKAMISSLIRGLKRGGRLFLIDGTNTMAPMSVGNNIIQHYSNAGLHFLEGPIRLPGYYEVLVVFEKS
ncbi:MAG: hypothetical protein A2284_09875 [Deltaproteobacteria bacterium RIFOXYA12_FULL_61_11]|nr:MAG: hypothetical protein A2284_09875 [Deltaproteobacteria bacterium RIFOXYA12_FULL_61_11]